MKTIFSALLLVIFITVHAQDTLTDRALSQSKIRNLVGAELMSATVSYAGLYTLWYHQQPQSKFHFFDDSREWAQMDKAGHTYSAYWLSATNTELLSWATMPRRKAALTATAMGWGYMAVIEIMDGFSSAWGASATDIAANTAGCTLFAGQELLLGKQEVRMKYSYSHSRYASLRPNVLGSSWNEQLLKDYNAQTYWLSCSLHSITSIECLPTWICISAGYGIDGFTGGHSNYYENGRTSIADDMRCRQFFLSLDADLTKIKTNKKWLRSVLFAINMIKIPAPTLELSKGKIRSYYFYF